MARSEFLANLTLCELPNTPRIGATFTKPAPVRPVHRPMVRPGFVVSLCAALAFVVIF